MATLAELFYDSTQSYSAVELVPGVFGVVKDFSIRLNEVINTTPDGLVLDFGILDEELRPGFSSLFCLLRTPTSGISHLWDVSRKSADLFRVVSCTRDGMVYRFNLGGDIDLDPLGSPFMDYGVTRAASDTLLLSDSLGVPVYGSAGPEFDHSIAPSGIGLPDPSFARIRWDLESLRETYHHNSNL